MFRPLPGLLLQICALTFPCDDFDDPDDPDNRLASCAPRLPFFSRYPSAYKSGYPVLMAGFAGTTPYSMRAVENSQYTRLLVMVLLALAHARCSIISSQFKSTWLVATAFRCLSHELYYTIPARSFLQLLPFRSGRSLGSRGTAVGCWQRRWS